MKWRRVSEAEFKTAGNKKHREPLSQKGELKQT
jgi:hypothetical protein